MLPAPRTKQQRFTRRHMARAFTGLAAVPLLTACAAVAADDRVLIELTDLNRFNPSGVTIPLGATVVWQNAGTGRHTATCNPELAALLTNVALPPAAAPWTSGDLYPGQTWEQAFTIPGLYLYFCRYHELEGMLGTITVEDAQSGTNANARES